MIYNIKAQEFLYLAPVFLQLLFLYYLSQNIVYIEYLNI